jgi:hypothetical protein
MKRYQLWVKDKTTGNDIPQGPCCHDKQLPGALRQAMLEGIRNGHIKTMTDPEIREIEDISH